MAVSCLAPFVDVSDGSWMKPRFILTGFLKVEIGSSWADQMEEGEAMYERDRPTQKVCSLKIIINMIMIRH